MNKSTGRVSIKVHPNDNVTTLLDANTDVSQLMDGTPIAAGIAMGHKVALADVSSGDAIIKYGVVIGFATQSISTGEHVHVHNCS